jgi:hypothetical protein
MCPCSLVILFSISSVGYIRTFDHREQVTRRTLCSAGGDTAIGVRIQGQVCVFLSCNDAVGHLNHLRINDGVRPAKPTGRAGGQHQSVARRSNRCKTVVELASECISNRATFSNVANTLSRSDLPRQVGTSPHVHTSFRSFVPHTHSSTCAEQFLLGHNRTTSPESAPNHSKHLRHCGTGHPYKRCLCLRKPPITTSAVSPHLSMRSSQPLGPAVQLMRLFAHRHSRE